MGASIRPLPVTHDDAEFQQWKAAQSAAPAQPVVPATHDEAEFQAWKASQSAPKMPQAIGASFAPQSTSVAPNQAARKTEQANRPLLESVDLPFGLQRDLNQAAQGASFGTSDEIMGGLRSLMGEKYSDAVAHERAGLADFQKDHHIRSLIDQIGGGVASTGGFTAVKPAATVLGRVAQSAGIGAGAGAATGAGSAEGGFTERAKGAAQGAGYGALFGGLVGGAGEGIRKLAGRGKETIDQIADRKLVNALGKDEMTPDQAITAAQSFSDDKPGVVLDIGGKNTNRLARAVRTQPSKGSAQLDEMLAGRAQGTEERTINDVISTTGLGKRENAFKKAEDLIAEQKANAKPLYDKAYAAPPIADAKIDEALKIPEFRAAYERGRRLASLDRVKLPALVSDEEAATAAARGAPRKLILTDQVRDPAGALRRDLSTVPDEHLENEWRRLAELNAEEEAMHGAVRDAGYREDYEALPRTEKLGHKGKEDLPDADGAIDAERLAADNKIVTDFRKSTIVRGARSKAMDRIQAELDRRVPPGADPTDFEFGANAEPKASGAPIASTTPPTPKAPRTYPTQALDYMKRGLDDLIRTRSEGESAIGHSEGRALRKRMSEVLDVADRANPDYRTARRQFADDARLQEAYDRGRQLFKTHPHETSLDLAVMSDGERELFRRGSLEALGDRIENRAPGRDPASLANKTLDKKRLRLMFDDEGSFGAFQKRLGEEAKMHQTKVGLTGGSQTADKLAELADMADLPVDAIVKAVTGHPVHAVSGLAKSEVGRRLQARLQGVTEAKADALSTRMQAGSQSRDDLIAMLKRAGQTVEAGNARGAARGTAVVQRAQRLAPAVGESGGLSTPQALPAIPSSTSNRDQKKHQTPPRFLSSLISQSP